MHICLVYDCVYPLTIGGAERWYRALAEALVADGHEVTYLTRRQWPKGQDAGLPGVRVVAVSPESELYDAAGRRRTLPPLAFGAGVLAHLLRHGRRYDVVHTASFPYFSLLAAAAARRRGRYRLVVDHHEVWTRDYWLSYAGTVTGGIGWLVQKACLRVRQTAIAFSGLTARRCASEGLRDPVTVVGGLYTGDLEAHEVREADPVVLYAGRHIPEKQVPAVVPAVARAHEALPELRGRILGDGPDRALVERLVDEGGLRDVVAVEGFVDRARLDRELAHALTLLLPSRREGYGIVVVEAASYGTPSIVVAGEDNAAADLVRDGVNGVVAPSASPEDLAAAILRVHELGPALRDSTSAWFEAEADALSMRRSIARVPELYAAAA